MAVANLACVAGVAAASFVGAYGALGGRHAMSFSQNDPLDVILADLRAYLWEIPLMARARQKARMDRRRADALRQLPTMMDVLTLGLSAGLSFDASLELYCRHYHTALSEALSESMLLWRMGGIGRGDALVALADDLDMAALRRFAAAVSQALAFGSPLATTLERQAQVIRDEQRAEMEAEIERAPVRMLIPLGTLIVPAMLLSILGPLLGPSVILT